MMKPTPLLRILVMLLYSVSVLRGEGGEKELPPVIPLPVTASEVPLAELEVLIRDRPNISILDVRTAEEMQKEGYLRGAKHLDVFSESFLENFKALKFEPSQPCIIYCAIGERARKAAVQIAGLGYKFIFLPEGGFNAWKKAGKPVEGGQAGK